MTKRRSNKKKWGFLVAASAAVATAATAWWVRREFVAITVEGMSMTPALYDGEKVLIRRGIRGLAKGRIVVLVRPHAISGWRHNPPAGRDLTSSGWYIKRVVAMAGDPYPPEVNRTGVVPSGHVVVMGDHRHSEDSKQHGPCPIDQILGIQVRKLSLARPADALNPPSPVWTDEDLDALSSDTGYVFTDTVEAPSDAPEALEMPDMPLPKAFVEAYRDSAQRSGGDEKGSDAAEADTEQKPEKKAAKKVTRKVAEKTAKKTTAKKTTGKAAKKTAAKKTGAKKKSGGPSQPSGEEPSEI